MKHSLAIGISLGLVLASAARSFDVAAWRGETVAVRIPDYAEVGEPPQGITVRKGVLKTIKYAPTQESLQRVECFDRVKWGNGDDGEIRIAEVTISPTMMAGDYDVGMMKVHVVNRNLPPPKEWKYFLDLWQHPWAVARMAGVKPFSKAHYAAMKPVWQELATAGQKTLTVTLLDQPWDHQCYDAYHSMIGRTRKKDGTWVFDYSIFDEYVEFGLSCGLGPNIACYTMCPWSYVCRYKDEEGKVVAVTCNPGTSEFEDYWKDFLIDFAKHLREKGWFEKALIAMDERSDEDVRNIANFIQKYAPGMRISMAGNRKPSDFKGIKIDVYAQVLLEKYCTPEFLKESVERSKKGLVTMHYVCCGPTYPNTFLSSGPGEAFWLGAYPAFCGLDGMLRWAWNSWPQNPKEDGTYWNWRSGDTFLVYPGGSPSWRFLELRNGIIAAEKLRILRAEGLAAEKIDAVAKLFNVADANANRSNFINIRKKVLELVNADR